MPALNKVLIIGGGAALVYLFRDQIESLIGITPPAPAITQATIAATTATAAGATPSQAAQVAAAVINNTPPAAIGKTLSQQLQARAAAAGQSPAQQAQFTAWQWFFYTTQGPDIAGTNGDLAPIANYVGWDEAALELPGMSADTFAAAVAAYRASKA